MENNNQHSQEHASDEAPKSVRERQPSTVWKKLQAKKWVFPTTYLAAAAIILGLMWWFQSGNDDLTTEGRDPGLDVAGNIDVGGGGGLPGSDTAPVQATLEEMRWPVVDNGEIIVLMPFYDKTASAEERAAALVRYGNEITPHMGISIGTADNAPFDVAAALSGTVTRVAQQPPVGNLVEITHHDGLVTVYQSLENVRVREGEHVEQGQIIAQAGRNELESDLGVHLHFEVRENGKPLNPQHYLPALGSERMGIGADEEAAGGTPQAAVDDRAAVDESGEDDDAPHEHDTDDETTN
jgi:stage II sporulation protein Q